MTLFRTKGSGLRVQDDIEIQCWGFLPADGGIRSDIKEVRDDIKDSQNDIKDNQDEITSCSAWNNSCLYIRKAPYPGSIRGFYW